MAELRERWASRPAFIMAAIGSAIGLGNVWRFPTIAFRNGGGAFFIPYFIALLTAGIPLMIVEYGLGSRYQGSAALSYRRLGRRYEWIGWWAVLVGLGISIYYCTILAWSWVYLVDSVRGLFGGTLPWPKNGSGKYFTDVVLKDTGDVEKFGSLVWPVVIGLAATWYLVYLSIVKGVLRVGKIVMVTVPLPLVLLVLLVLRGLTLPNAMSGLAYYLSPDWSRLLVADTWIEAYSQVFFSLSVGWGILIAYSSYMSRKTDVVNNAYITSFANCGFSFLAGFAVFSTLGFLASAINTPIGDMSTIGGGLAFITYPTAIENFPGGGVIQALVAIGFFLMLFTLGIDSAFSIVEAVATAMYDKFKMTRTTVTRILCAGGFVLGLIYCFGAGNRWLDITDKFLSDFGLALVAFVQCVLVAWVIPRSKFRDLMVNINERSELKIGPIWTFSLRYVTPLVLGASILISTYKMLDEGFQGNPTWTLVVGGLMPAVGVLVVSFVLMSAKGKSDEED